MKTAINLINLKERHANFKALSALNLAQPRGASVKFASLQGGGLNFMRSCGAKFQKGRA